MAQEKTKIRCKFLSGNFGDVSVDDFVAAFRAAVERDYPNADIEIDVQNASGSGAYYLIDNQPSSELQYLSEDVWERLLS